MPVHPQPPVLGQLCMTASACVCTLVPWSEEQININHRVGSTTTGKGLCMQHEWNLLKAMMSLLL